MLFQIATAQGGKSQAIADVCLTPAPPGPPQPMAYASLAELIQVNPGTCSKKVLVLSQPVLHQNTKILATLGNEAGTVGGVASGTVKGPACPIKVSSKVLVEGFGAARLTSQFGHNGASANTVGFHCAPSQNKVLVGD